jgi:putative ABC transport system permease protein
VKISGLLEAFTKDVRYAGRVLRKSPAFALSAVLTIAIGIGSTTLMFSMLNSLVLQPPPFPHANQLFLLWGKIPDRPQIRFSTKEFLAWRDQAQTLESVAAFSGNGFVYSARGDSKIMHGQLVTPSFFDALEIPPLMGRPFLPSEGEPGHEHVVALSYSFWQETFAGRRDVIGQSVTLNGEPYEITAVMPRDFDFPDREVKFWVPAALHGGIFQQHPDAHFLQVLARTKIGITQEQLRAETDLLGKRVRAANDDPNRQFYAVTLQESLNGNLRQPLIVLQFAVCVLLLIACTNVANLMLARAGARQREMAVRGALGATRFRLIFQMLIESALVATLAGAVGIALSFWGLHLLVLYGVKIIPQLAHVRVDGWALGFAFAISALCGTASGLLPALAASRTFTSALKESTRTTQGAVTERTRSILVFAEVAMAATLLAGSGLMIKSFVRLSDVDPGFRPRGVIALGASLKENTYPESSNMILFYRKTLADIRALPGVTASGMTAFLPFGGNDWGNTFDVEGKPAPAGTDYVAQIRPASPGYFSAMGIPLMRGRDFSDLDSENSSGVAIVNEVLASRFWGSGDPIGQHIRFDSRWLTIAGVVGNIKHEGLDSDTVEEIYVPYPQLPPSIMKFLGRDNNYVIRTAGNPAPIVSMARNIIHSRDPEMAIEINLMDQLISESIRQPRLRAWLVGSFSFFALILACVGIYGVIAYLVSQRFQEIGIRMALGAQRSNIVRLVLARVIRLAAAGIVAGLCATFYLSHFLGKLLFGITGHDPLTFLGAALLLMAVATMASYLPARRATRINPVDLLRHE